ncbi:hypothetical protein Celaphus_00004789, partial [Cervus elaphus hippelaphus]
MSSLAIENAPEDVQEYSWHRGANDTEENLIISYNTTSHSRRDGPMYSGRESVSIRGTLRIRRSQLNDTGNYTVRVDTINDTQRATGWLEILGHRPVVSRSFTISGSLLVLLIIFIVLGFTHFLVVLIRALFRHYSTRYLLHWAQ